MKLIDVTEKNWLDVIFLSTNGKVPNLCEEFVASNALSLVQAQFEPYWVTKAIEVDGQLVGFAMYGFEPDTQQYTVCRLMIDQKFQGKGYGRLAMKLIITELSKNDNCHEIYLSTEPHNRIGKNLYESLGFINTNQIVDDEEVYRLPINA